MPEVDGQGDVADQQHLVAVAAGELNERILAGHGVAIARRHNGIGDAVIAANRDTLGFGVESVRNVHVWKDFFAGFHAIGVDLVGLDFNQSQLCFGIDQARIDRHAVRVDDRGPFGDGRASGPDGGDFTAGEDKRAVLDNAVRNGEQLAAGDGDGGGGLRDVDHDGLGQRGRCSKGGNESETDGHFRKLQRDERKGAERTLRTQGEREPSRRQSRRLRRPCRA